MNELIKQQLLKCRTANIPLFDDNTTSIFIEKKSDNNGITIRENGCYLIEISNYVLHPSPDYSFHINWNNGNIPTCRYYKCEVTKIMKDTIKINGCGFDGTNDLNVVWSGWLPLKGISILREL